MQASAIRKCSSPFVYFLKFLKYSSYAFWIIHQLLLHNMAKILERTSYKKRWNPLVGFMVSELLACNDGEEETEERHS